MKREGPLWCRMQMYIGSPVASAPQQTPSVRKGIKEFLDNYLVDIDHSFHTLSGNQLEAAVQAFTESRDIDMIAMVAKNLNFFERILFRPDVEKISYYVKVPFLVLHE